MTRSTFQRLFTVSGLLVSLVVCAVAQSGREYRRSGVMNGNQVRTVFGNWGVIGQPGEQGKRGAWRNDNNGYLGDVSPLVGAEVTFSNKVFHSVVSPPVSRPTRARDEDPNTGKPWTFEPVNGYFNPNGEKVALSSDKSSWPTTWPDKLSDANDVGWSGSWNGYFGKGANADLETYFVMDDNNDERYNKANNNPQLIAFKPDANNPSRNGLGLVMKVRAMQWAQFLAKDNIFWLYEITNSGTTNYDKTVFGMLVGTYVGVTSTEDYQEYADDWSFFDVNANITFSGDYGRSTSNPLWVGPIGMVGYAFLESPGNPFDGIDNDGDADSSSFGVITPKFAQTSFDTTTLNAGMQIILIDSAYHRTLFAVPNTDSVLVTTRGYTRYIKPGITKVAEGNILKDSLGNEFINPNAYDGQDNDYDGLIDENYYLHYRQVKRTRTLPITTLIDILRPVHFINYVTGSGTNAMSMIDERRDDRVDNNGDWNPLRDDVGRDGKPNSGDIGESDAAPTSGYDALGNDTGLPGEPHIDKTDVKESDQIGLSSFSYFTPSNNFSYADDEGLWKSLAPGYFDVPSTIVNNRPLAGVDGDFFYASGYFPLRAKTTERFSLALVYGGGKGGSLDDDIADLLKNKKTVQKIYDANYQFPQPPEKPVLTAVPGDREVTLYWDRVAESSIDPVLQIPDFEGYKIYKSTDPNFSDIFTITDGSGSPQGYRPLVQYDVRNGIKGYFKPNGELFEAAAGYSFYLGSDNGLQHSYVDHEVENGRRYYYAIVSYDRGDESIGIFPSENTKFISILPSGEVTHDQNVAIVSPNAKSAGYDAPPTGTLLTSIVTYGTGKVAFDVVDPAKVTGHTYRLEFLDTQNDSIDNNGNGKMDASDSSETIRLTSKYSVMDLDVTQESFTSVDTTIVILKHQNLIAGTVTVQSQSGSVINPSFYTLDLKRGSIRGSSPGSLPEGNYSVTFRYYPVFQSRNIKGSPYVVETKDADIFDGIQLNFSNVWGAEKIDSLSHWFGADPYRFGFTNLDVEVPPKQYLGIRKPSDYIIQFANTIVDSSYDDPELAPGAIPVNFRIFNATDSVYIKFIFVDTDGNGKLSPQDEIVFVEKEPKGNLIYTWDIRFSAKTSDPPDTTYNLGSAVRLELRMTKPFRKGDIMQFATTLPSVNAPRATEELSKIRVVPNPYVTSSSFEPPLNPGITSGRGTRKIDFTHLPANAVVHIFTSRGDHVQSLKHDGNIEDGTLSWNLKTKENLDVAFGIYFYVVESIAGTKTGKFAIIK